MKQKEINEEAIKYVYKEWKDASHTMKGGLTTGFIEGAEWMQSQYGVSPETVKEMLEALRSIESYLSDKDGWNNNEAHIYSTVDKIINKAEQELNTK